MNKIKEFFNNIADEWNNDLDDINKIESLLNELYIKNGDSVLDVGCGKGIITPLLSKRSQNRVVAMDLSENMIKGAIESHSVNSNLEFICGDFLESDFKSQFDYIVMFNAYPHFMEVDRLSSVVYKALKDEGHFAIIHSLSKEELNTHHKQHAMKVSRPLDSADMEAKKFVSQFDIEKTIDEKDRYLIILKKKK